MKFVRELPEKRHRRGSKYDRMIGTENLTTLRHNPSRWALVAEKQPKSEQSGFHAWGKRAGLQTAVRTNQKTPDTIDLYARYQPSSKGGHL